MTYPFIDNPERLVTHTTPTASYACMCTPICTVDIKGLFVIAPTGLGSIIWWHRRQRRRAGRGRGPDGAPASCVPGPSWRQQGVTGAGHPAVPAVTADGCCGEPGEAPHMDRI